MTCTQAFFEFTAVTGTPAACQSILIMQPHGLAEKHAQNRAHSQAVRFPSGHLFCTVHNIGEPLTSSSY